MPSTLAMRTATILIRTLWSLSFLYTFSNSSRFISSMCLLDEI